MVKAAKFEQADNLEPLAQAVKAGELVTARALVPSAAPKDVDLAETRPPTPIEELSDLRGKMLVLDLFDEEAALYKTRPGSRAKSTDRQVFRRDLWVLRLKEGFAFAGWKGYKVIESDGEVVGNPDDSSEPDFQLAFTSYRSHYAGARNSFRREAEKKKAQKRINRLEKQVPQEQTLF